MHCGTLYVYVLCLMNNNLTIISGTDDDDVIVRSFEAFEINGQIDAEM